MIRRRFILPEDERVALETQLGRFTSTALHTLTLAEARAQLDERRARRSPEADAGVLISDESISRGLHHIRVRTYEPALATALGVIVYSHGGGWVMGQTGDFDATCSTLARLAEVKVISVDYRLAPEHPFPAALEDVMETLRIIATAAHQTARCPVFLAGESAGGNLALAAAIGAREEGLPDLAGVLLFFPMVAFVDHTMELDAAFDSPFLSVADLPWYWAHYLPHAWMKTDPRATPGEHGSLGGLPPTLLVHGTRDPISKSVTGLGRRMSEAGVSIEEWVYDGLPHAFTALPQLGIVQQALNDVAHWIKARRDSLERESK